MKLQIICGCIGLVLIAMTIVNLIKASKQIDSIIEEAKGGKNQN